MLNHKIRWYQQISDLRWGKLLIPNNRTVDQQPYLIALKGRHSYSPRREPREQATVNHQAPQGRKNSVAPAGMTPWIDTQPTAHAVGFKSSALMGLFQSTLKLTILLLLYSPLQASSQNRLPFDVLHYDVEITPNFTEKTILGDVSIRLTSRVEKLSEVAFTAHNLTIDRVSLNGQEPAFKTSEGRLLIKLAAPVAKDETLTLRIRYHGMPKRGVRFYPDHMYTVYNTGGWLPCQFHPSDKATLKLQLILPTNMKAVANGRLVEQQALPENRTKHVWQEDMPIPAYIFGFAAGQFQETVKRAGRVELRDLYRSRTAAEINQAFSDTADMIRFFEERAGVRLPGNRYTQVFAEGRVEQEMAGFTVIRESYVGEVLAEPRDNWLGAHELSHQWWGNSVTCLDWSHFWLNEGIASFIAAAYKEHRFGADEYGREIELARRAYAKLRSEGRDRPLAFREWVEENKAGGYIVYDKGTLILHLLRNQLGETAFWNGLRRFTQKNFGGSVTTDDLQAAMEAASGEKLDEFFENWIYKADVPELVTEHRMENDEVVVNLEQRQAALWPIPLQLAIETADGRQHRRVILQRRTEEVRFKVRGAPLSVRVDDGGHWPVRIAHPRPMSMLLYQLKNEPDVAGRVDALEKLAVACRKNLVSDCNAFRASLRERINKDSSRLVRQLAREQLRQKGDEQ